VTEAALTLAALEACRHQAMLSLTALDAQRAKVAYAIVAQNNIVAKQRWHELNDEATQLAEKIVLFDHALIEARERAAHPDWQQQFVAITGVKTP
jgi:hypothetical protein